MTRPLFSLFVFVISYSTFSQTDFKNDSFIKENILDRGYHEPKFLFELNGAGYYWIISRPSKRYVVPPSHMKSEPILVAIHDIETDVNILDLEAVGTKNESQTQQYSYKNLALHEKLNVFLAPIALSNTYSLQIYHFVKDLYLENHNGIDNHQIRFQKDKNDKDVEDPILKSRHSVFESKITNGSISLGTHASSATYDRNSAKDALLIRNKQTTKGVENTKVYNNRANTDFVESDGDEYNRSNNPSGIVLRFDGKRRGNRNRGSEILYGEEAAGKIRDLNRLLLEGLSSDGNIIVINWETYLNNVFYGNFDKLKPELTNRGILGNSSDHFPEFHNGFLYYVHQLYGDDYYPNLTYKDFEIITTRTTKDGTGGIVNESKTKKPYRIFLPHTFKPKFEQYLDKDQFTWSGEQFDLEMEYLILDFLEQYDPSSHPFKQLMNNIYRYSKDSEPVTKKSELVGF